MQCINHDTAEKYSFICAPFSISTAIIKSCDKLVFLLHAHIALMQVKIMLLL